MMKNNRVLIVSTVAATIGSFNMENIRILQDLGFTVDVAADFTDTSVWSEERLQEFICQLDSLKIEHIQIDFSRNLFKIRKHYYSYKEALTLLRERKYCFIHTHTPIASAIMRLAAKETNTKVVYTAHGFHFYQGAPLKNWILFYPFEKLLSKYTDVLITINKEDFHRAEKHFYAKKIVYVPGVGVNIKRFAPCDAGRDRIRNELSLKKTDIMLLSVGELNENKNHSSVIKALKGTSLVYVIVGKGEKREELDHLAKELQVDLRLCGFRKDISDFYNAADYYILPSIREGLNVSLMEAMASGLPVACSKIRGNVDLIDSQGGFLFYALSIDDISRAIRSIIDSDKKQMSDYNLQKIEQFDCGIVNKEMRDIYSELKGRK